MVEFLVARKGTKTPSNAAHIKVSARNRQTPSATDQGIEAARQNDAMTMTKAPNAQASPIAM